MKVEVTDPDGERDHACEARQVRIGGVGLQGVGDVPEADDAADLLVLLVAAHSEHLAEVLLVETLAACAVVALDDLRGQAVEVLDRGCEVPSPRRRAMREPYSSS